MNIAFWLARTAAKDPARLALFDGETAVASYGALWREVLVLAGWLTREGVSPGDRVAIFMANRPDYLTALFGIWSAGAVAVPINAKLHPREVAWILGNAGASFCLTGGGTDGALSDLAPCPVIDLDTQKTEALPLAEPVARAPSDTAWLFYTSGTTGRPKGVQITHRNLVSMSLCYQSDVDPVRADHAAVYAAPMSHGAGLYSLMHVRAGARHVFPGSRGFDPAEVLSLARSHGAVHMFAAPTMVKRLTDHAVAKGADGTGLETVVYAGGPMYEADILRAVDHFGPVFAQIYGQGECTMGITALTKAEVADRASDGWRSRLNSVGRAQSAVLVRVVDDRGRGVKVGEVGEIEVFGDTVMAGYWNAPEATAATLRDGWLKTGDLGALDAKGYLTLMDRSKDLIISGGTNIYPREVEDVLLQHPAVSEVSVIGRPHPEWGEEVVAFVVLRSAGAASAEALDAHCLSRIARFKRPKIYRFVADLPKNNYGKVLKTELRAVIETDPPEAGPVPKSVP